MNKQSRVPGVITLFNVVWEKNSQFCKQMTGQSSVSLTSYVVNTVFYPV
jgi:hypothetical protein